jgi:hypothetical protein
MPDRLLFDLTTRSQFTLEPCIVESVGGGFGEPLGGASIGCGLWGTVTRGRMGIRTLAEVASGRKGRLVDRYLIATVGQVREWGVGELVGWLMTLADERNETPEAG